MTVGTPAVLFEGLVVEGLHVHPVVDFDQSVVAASNLKLLS